MKCKYCDKEHQNNNTGCSNSGNWNSGNWNSGDRNSGNWNSGNWNSGNWNSGYYNTDEPDRIRVFNQWLEMKPSEFLEKYDIYADIPLNRWINKEDMSQEEKKSVKGWEEMGGYLKTLDFKEACRVWWKENPNEHKRFTELPFFNWKLFTEITGIEPEESLSGKKVSVELDGKKYTATID